VLVVPTAILNVVTGFEFRSRLVVVPASLLVGICWLKQRALVRRLLATQRTTAAG
jgi:hypothetical protein